MTWLRRWKDPGPAHTHAPATDTRPCPTAQQHGRTAAIVLLKQGTARDPRAIERRLETDANIYPIVRRCRGDWLTGFYAELQGKR